MLILKIDSREQKPLSFRTECFDKFVVEGLPFGDYWCSVGGHEVPICFERKALGDLFGNMTNGYERFKKEMGRAKAAGHSLILLIEGSMRQVAAGYEHSQYSGDSMLKKLAMLRVRYDLESHFFNDRREMARYITEIYQAVGRNYKVNHGKDE